MFLELIFASVSLPSDRTIDNSWNQRMAATYLDQRAAWWMAWPGSARGHGTFCISCHTAVPYALSRPALRAAVGEQGASNSERKLLENVTKRVLLWKGIEPFYSDETDGVNKTAESRGTEAVLNALVLASHDAPQGTLSHETQIALKNMWSLQVSNGNATGAWWWLQFNNEPFEGHDSQYYGATLAAIAVGITPEQYRASPEIQNNLKLLQDYLNRAYTKQSIINHAVLLWASARWPGLLTQERQNSIVSDLLRQQQTDGGWNLASLAWNWRDLSLRSFVKMFFRSYGTPLEGKSDGYATGLITFVLEQAGLRRGDRRLAQARAWLIHNQNKTEGSWPSYSLNNRRDASSATGHFMSDIATAYAVLALTDVQ